MSELNLRLCGDVRESHGRLTFGTRRRRRLWESIGTVGTAGPRCRSWRWLLLPDRSYAKGNHTCQQQRAPKARQIVAPSVSPGIRTRKPCKQERDLSDGVQSAVFRRPFRVCRKNGISPCRLRDLRVSGLKFAKKKVHHGGTEKRFSDRL